VSGPRLPAALLALLACAVAASAQLSPGKLSRPHRELEGLTRCTQCHELGKPIDGARCLACHAALDARIKARRGFHGRDEVRTKACVSCHSDHHGLDFPLVRWEKGMEAFDHSRTGWKLEGAHRTAKCRDCHRRELVDPELRKRTDLHPARTFLGLSGECRACHRDEHAGQLGEDCAACHDAAGWQRTSFDHAKARFPLTGAHRELACAACHKPELARPRESAFVVDKAPADRAARYRPLPFSRCTDCHRDPHEGRLGSDCASCHSTATFATGREGFDHARTRYPLSGAHQRVACADCHRGPDAGLRPPDFRDCAPCHTDPHGGQFRARGREQACSSCHDTERFTPSLFGVARHQASRFPLTGAHQAVACGDCHTRRSPHEPVRYDLGGRGFSGQACLDCHADVHEGQAAPWMGEAGCLDCHSTEAWRVAAFDHGRTDFALEGAHRAAACGACHLSQGRRVVQLKGLGRACAGCHADPHRGQFLAAAAAVDCARCHTNSDWKASRFSHDATRFPLEGRHREVACAVCHQRERDPDGEFVRYKPLGSRCEDCHGSSSKKE